MFLHGILDTKGVTRMGQATACMDLPCEWAQFLYTCAERGIEDSALILIATWYRQGPPMTQQFSVNHGHPDGDLMTSIGTWSAERLIPRSMKIGRLIRHKNGRLALRWD